MEYTGLTNTSPTPFRVKSRMVILGHLSGTPRGAGVSQWAETSKMSLEWK